MKTCLPMKKLSVLYSFFNVCILGIKPLTFRSTPSYRIYKKYDNPLKCFAFDKIKDMFFCTLGGFQPPVESTAFRGNGLAIFLMIGNVAICGRIVGTKFLRMKHDVFYIRSSRWWNPPALFYPACLNSHLFQMPLLSWWQ